jgi:hypothetical protein
MDLMDSLVKEREMQHSMGPVEEEVLAHEGKVHLPHEFKTYKAYIEGADDTSYLG